MSDTKQVKFSEVIGEGPVRIVALHRWMGDHGLFKPTLPFWDRRGFTVAFFDCRGYGKRLGETGAFTIEEVASDVEAATKALGWADYHVIGHSMAGMSAQWLTVDPGSRVRSIILVASVPATGAKINEERRDLLTKAISDPEARKALINVNTGGKKPDAWLSTLRDLSIAGTDSSALKAYMSSWTGTDFSAKVAGNKTPVSVIIGADDPGVSETKSRETYGSWFDNITVNVMPATGHYPMYEKPKEFVELVSIFLSRF